MSDLIAEVTACEHEIGYRALGGFPGHEHVHPTGPQVCLRCGRTLKELLTEKDAALVAALAAAQREAAEASAQIAGLTAERDAEQLAHDKIASLCFAVGADTADGTSVAAVQSAVALLSAARAEVEQLKERERQNVILFRLERREKGEAEAEARALHERVAALVELWENRDCLSATAFDGMMSARMREARAALAPPEEAKP